MSCQFEAPHPLRQDVKKIRVRMRVGSSTPALTATRSSSFLTSVIIASWPVPYEGNRSVPGLVTLARPEGSGDRMVTGWDDVQLDRAAKEAGQGVRCCRMLGFESCVP